MKQISVKVMIKTHRQRMTRQVITRNGLLILAKIVQANIVYILILDRR